MNAPQGLKRPGVTAVDPRNAAANAGSSSCVLIFGSDEPRVPAKTTPANALITLVPIRAPARIASTLTPERRATERPAPTRIRDTLITPAKERSNSPAVNESSRPSVRSNRTAWEPKIVWKLAVVKNVDGRSAENTTITANHAIRIPKRYEKRRAAVRTVP